MLKYEYPARFWLLCGKWCFDSVHLIYRVYKTNWEKHHVKVKNSISNQRNIYIVNNNIVYFWHIMNNEYKNSYLIII